MTAFKSFTHGAIALSVLVSAPLFCAAIAQQEPTPPLGNVSDEDDPGLAQIQQRLKDEQFRLGAANQTYDYTRSKTSQSSTTFTGTTTGSVSEIDELNANPQLKSALVAVRAELIRGDWNTAITTLEGLIRRNPSGITARRFLAYALLRIGNADGAVRQILSYTKVVAPTAVDDYVLGTAYNTMGDLEGARDAFKDAIVKEPGMDSARAELVKVLVSLYDYDRALAICKDRLAEVKDARTQDYYRRLYQSVLAAKRGSNTLLPPTPTSLIPSPGM